MSPRLAFLLVLAAAGCGQGAAPVADRPPNLVLILADDLGIGDLGCTGGTIATPRIDELARAGALYTQATVASPLCSPSRAGLLTGRHPARFGLELNPDADSPGELESVLDARAILPELLRERGYATGCVGKWHLGRSPEAHPLARGFDEFYGFLPGAHVYFPKDGRNLKPENPILRGHDPVREEEYLTRGLAREAVRFVRAHREEPFFLFAAFNAPHLPLQAPREVVERMAGPEERRTYAAMVTLLDEAVGAVLDALEECGLAEDTLVVFLSDNGAPVDTGSNGALRHGKRSLFEGGVRVPLVLRWPGRVAPGTRVEEPVSALDVAPTLLRAAGAPSTSWAEMDGHDLFEPHPARALFWKLGPSRAIRRGDWKLLASGRSRWLFDLAHDPGEEHDLSEGEPARARELEDELRRWLAALPEGEPMELDPALRLQVHGKPYWLAR